MLLRFVNAFWVLQLILMLFSSFRKKGFFTLCIFYFNFLSVDRVGTGSLKKML